MNGGGCRLSSRYSGMKSIAGGEDIDARRTRSGVVNDEEQQGGIHLNADANRRIEVALSVPGEGGRASGEPE